MSSNAQKLVNGSVLRIADFFLNAFTALMLMPFVIHSLGDNIYGLWILIGSFLGYYGLMDFGLSSAVQRFVSRAIGESSQDKVSRIINTAFFLYLIIGLITLIVSIGTAFILPVFIKNITEVSLFRKIILILGLSFSIGFPARVFSGILTADLRFDLNTIVDLSKVIMRTALVIIFLKYGAGVIALAIITLVTDIGKYAATYCLVRHNYKKLVLSVRLVDKTMLKPLFGYSVYTFVAQLADILRFNVDHLVITIFMNLNSVTLYSIASRLIKYFMDFISSALGMLTPLFSQYEAKNDYNSIKEKFLFATRISSFASILIGAIMILFGNLFIEKWLGHKYLGAYPILVVLVIPVTIALMQSPTVQLLFGISKHRFFTISNSLEGITNLILSLILVRKYGLMGVALGTAIPLLIIKLFIQPVYTCKIIKLNISKYYFYALLQPLIISLTIFSILWFFIKNLVQTDYFSIAAFIFAISFLFCASIFFLGFRASERKYIQRLFLDIKRIR